MDPPERILLLFEIPFDELTSVRNVFGAFMFIGVVRFLDGFINKPKTPHPPPNGNAVQIEDTTIFFQFVQSEMIAVSFFKVTCVVVSVASPRFRLRPPVRYVGSDG